MKVELRHIDGMTFAGTNAAGIDTLFDASVNHGGQGRGASPMEVFLESMVACTSMDVLDILRKKRKTIDGYSVKVSSTRADDHPKVFTSITMDFTLVSPDAELKDLERSVELSQTKYCSAAAMVRNSGCEMKWNCTIERPQ